MLKDKELQFIVVSRVNFELLEPHQGWLQMESWSRAGMTRLTRSLYRFNGKRYALYRTDTWDSEETGKMRYRGTLFNKSEDDSRSIRNALG